MIKDYRSLSSKINSRMNPEGLVLEKSFSQDINEVKHSDVLVYVRTAMKGVDPAYTGKSRLAGEKVKNHLKKVLTDVDYEYQGSVMTDTHIRGYSDIDLLAICTKFYSCQDNEIKSILESHNVKSQYSDLAVKRLENESKVSYYSGNALNDLKNQRIQSELILSDVYSKCDIKHPKAIKIRNLSLGRDVDIVTANWYDNISSIINDKGAYRGIQVYDKEKHAKGAADYPFLSIKRINERSSSTNGRLKRMIRFLKNLKEDSNQDIKLSSFDINAICYDIDVNKYFACSYYELVPVLYNQLFSICTNKQHSDNLVSVDGREPIFRGNSEKLENLKTILEETQGVYNELIIQGQYV